MNNTTPGNRPHDNILQTVDAIWRILVAYDLPISEYTPEEKAKLKRKLARAIQQGQGAK